MNESRRIRTLRRRVTSHELRVRSDDLQKPKPLKPDPKSRSPKSNIEGPAAATQPATSSLPSSPRSASLLDQPTIGRRWNRRADGEVWAFEIAAAAIVARARGRAAGGEARVGVGGSGRTAGACVRVGWGAAVTNRRPRAICSRADRPALAWVLFATGLWRKKLTPYAAPSR